MVFPDFDPVLLQIGPIAIRWYALAYVAGILLGWWYALRLVRNEKIWAPVQPPLTKVQIDDLVLWSTLGIIVGMGLAYGVNLLLMDKYSVPRLPVVFLPIGAALLYGLGQIAVLGPALRASTIPPASATRSV